MHSRFSRGMGPKWGMAELRHTGSPPPPPPPPPPSFPGPELWGSSTILYNGAMQGAGADKGKFTFDGSAGSSFSANAVLPLAVGTYEVSFSDLTTGGNVEASLAGYTGAVGTDGSTYSGTIDITGTPPNDIILFTDVFGDGGSIGSISVRQIA